MLIYNPSYHYMKDYNRLYCNNAYRKTKLRNVTIAIIGNRVTRNKANDNKSNEIENS